MTTAIPDHAQASLQRILHSGDYVRRPHRQIFVEHEFYNRQGQVTRKVTHPDLVEIANKGNTLAKQGSLAKIGFGHTLDDVLDANGNVVKHYSEEEQPRPIGYLHNYSVEKLPDGRWALFADQYVQKVLTDEKGQSVDGAQYAATYPDRSPEYFPSKKWIDWLALLRRTPALNMGTDAVAYAERNPDKVFYRPGNDGAMLIGAIENGDGRWRYAQEKDMDSDDSSAPSGAPAAAAAPAGPNPTQPPDDRPPIPGKNDMGSDLPPAHKECADKYATHCHAMHPSQSKALLHHVHSMYAAQLGLPQDKMAPHTPPATPLAQPGPATPGAVATGPATPGQPAAPVQDIKKTYDAGPGVPGGGNTYIPGTEKQRMSETAIKTPDEMARMVSVQQGIAANLQQTDLERERYARQELEKRIDAMETSTRRANYERDLTGLLGMGFNFDLAEEVTDMERFKYDEATCKRQIDRIKKNYQRAPVGGPMWVRDNDDRPQQQLPSRGTEDGPPDKISYEIMQKAKKYATKNGCEFDEAVEKVRAESA